MNDVPVVHVVDDDDSIRTALTRLLGANGYQTRAYSSAGEFLMEARTGDPGCVLLDINMPGPSGLELHESMARNEIPLQVIFLTGYGSIPMSVRAMKAGAVDFLTKPVEKQSLIKAVEKAINLDRERRATVQRNRELRERYESLTTRERQVFALVTQGRLNKQIATELGTSERTIKAHRAQVMEKMCTRSVADLVRAADQIRDSGITVSRNS